MSDNRHADLVFIGPNPKNASGTSSKFYRLRPGSKPYTVLVTYGRIGAAGQTIEYDQGTARAKLHEKLRKGYVYAEDPALPAPKAPARRTSAWELAQTTTWKSGMTFDTFIGVLASKEAIELTTSEDGIRLYLSRGWLMAARREGDRFGIAWLGPVEQVVVNA